jgi:hypothetical protein
MGHVEEFLALAAARGSDIQYHRDDSFIPCPCLTPEGFRDPIWHIQNPDEDVCNEAGMLPQPGTTADFTVKGWVQPVQAGAVRRLTTEQLIQIFGEVDADDQLGIFPCEWSGKLLNFYQWGPAQEDYITYNGRRFTCVNANLIAAPDTGYPFHHWEVGLRLIDNG